MILTTTILVRKYVLINDKSVDIIGVVVPSTHVSQYLVDFDYLGVSYRGLWEKSEILETIEI